MLSASPFSSKNVQEVFPDVWFVAVWGRGGRTNASWKLNFFSYCSYFHNPVSIKKYFPQKGKQYNKQR